MALNLSEYTDREIVDALVELRAVKFLRVMNAIGAISEKLIQRGKLIANQRSDEEIDSLLEGLGDTE